MRDHRDELDDVAYLLAAYNRGERAEAEDLYGDYVDAVDAVADALAALRDRYAATVDDAGAYVRSFNRSAARRLPDIARGLHNR